MATRAWIRPLSAGDILHVSRNMREMDAREIFLMVGHLNRDSFAAVTATMAAGARIALGFGLDGAPFCAAVLIICKSDSSPWLGSASLFATDDFPRVAHTVVRFVRRTVIPGLIGEGMRRVECRALASYAATRRFLRACGAVEEAELPDSGPNGEPYVLCTWRRRDFVKESADVHRGTGAGADGDR